MKTRVSYYREALSVVLNLGMSEIAGFIAVGASLMLTLAVAEVPAAVLILLSYSLFALAGGAMADYRGAILSAAFFGLLCAISSAVEMTWSLRHNKLIERLVVRSKTVGDGTLRLLDRIILSPCLWRIVAIGRRFPWRHDQFMSFCKDAFLLKQSSQECEFIHRLLRDYFALRELRPRLSASDKHRRLDVIRFLGYQGEAALDVLTEFAGDQEPSVRAAALTGLSHISSPIVTRCFELHIDDRNPLVRQAIIPGIFRLPDENKTQLLSRLQPLGDGCEVEPLLDCLQALALIRRDEEIYDVLKRLGKAAMEPLKGRLRSRDKHARQVAVGALVQFFSEVEQQLLSTKVDGYSPWLDPAKPISRSRVVRVRSPA